MLRSYDVVLQIDRLLPIYGLIGVDIFSGMERTVADLPLSRTGVPGVTLALRLIRVRRHWFVSGSRIAVITLPVLVSQLAEFRERKFPGTARVRNLDAWQ